MGRGGGEGTDSSDSIIELKVKLKLKLKLNLKTAPMWLDVIHLDRVRDVETLLHARDVELENPQVFTLDGDGPRGSRHPADTPTLM